jgi:hypothetical protein
MKIKRNFLRLKELQKRRNDPISALEVIESFEKVRIRVKVPYETAKKVTLFLGEKGIPKSQGIPMLIQYGLSDESKEELERLKDEMESENGRNLWGEYAVMKFRVYEYFMENKVMVINLPRMLDENRMLKRRLEMEGLTELIPKDEWDNWDKSVIDAYYRKYVFGERR